MDKVLQDRVNSWLTDFYDENTKKEIKNLLSSNNEKELTDSFYKDLEFGTGGLRGIMGVGTNRMNKYTVALATQGLCNYLLKTASTNLSVAIGYDTRNNSKYFAEITAEILSSNKIKVYLYDDKRPISLLSYATRYLKCNAGVVITASHNPKEYNGYKAYWSDGAQVIPPHDKNIIEEVLKVKNEDIKMGDKSLINIIGMDIEDKYIAEINNYIVKPDIIKKHADIKIVYTPIHGSGYKLVPRALKSVGFNSIVELSALQPPDGNFPTVASPNPEEPAALKIAIDKAKELKADLVMGTDPDCDRMGCALRDKNGEYKTLTGNQIGSLISYYILSNKKMPANPYIVKTIVTTELVSAIAKEYNIELINVLTGFKWIADIIENKKDGKYIFGFEESYGYLINENVRDKDAVSSCVILAEIAAYCKENNMSLLDYLESIYKKFGFFFEETVSITKKGADGAKEIADMMTTLRGKTINSIGGVKVLNYYDYENRVEVNYKTNAKKDIKLPKSNVLQYILEDGSKITVRPSGTEPKIKFYFEVCVKDAGIDRDTKAKEKIAVLKKDIVAK